MIGMREKMSLIMLHTIVVYLQQSLCLEHPHPDGVQPATSNSPMESLLSRGGTTPPRGNKLLKTGFTAARWNSPSSNMMATSSAIMMGSVAVSMSLMLLEKTLSAGIFVWGQHQERREGKLVWKNTKSSIKQRILHLAHNLPDELKANAVTRMTVNSFMLG